MVEIEMTGAAIIFAAAFVFEMIDSSCGQGYGTLGSPTYILMGYDPKLIVPAILLSQATGGLVNTYMHNFWGNASFWGKEKTENGQKMRPDTKQALIIMAAGAFAAAAAAWFGVSKLTGDEISLYMGLLVLAIGVIVILGFKFTFTWKKMVGVGIYSAVNKSLTGGGYGPVTCGGQVVCGTESKRAVAITNFAEVPICIIGFIIWMLMSYRIEFIPIVAPMALGAGMGAMIGPWFAYKTPPAWFSRALGVVFLLLGLSVLWAIL